MFQISAQASLLLEGLLLTLCHLGEVFSFWLNSHTVSFCCLFPPFLELPELPRLFLFVSQADSSSEDNHTPITPFFPASGPS
jgi:hypothetical protein